MNYSDIRQYDTTNVISGIASSLFVSGCNFHCPQCFNQEAQDFQYGKPFTKEIEDMFIEYIKSPRIKQASLLGGEVFHQDLDIIFNLVKRIKKETNRPIYIWTGFKWKDLIKNQKILEILKYVDVVIDGQFEMDKKDITLRLRGSSNQRIINVQESLLENKVIIYES